MTEESREVEVRGLDPWGLRRVEQLLQTRNKSSGTSSPLSSRSSGCR
jgi:hypothetical protein